MDIGSLFLLFLGFCLIFFAVQRADPKKRRIVALCMIVPGILLQRYAAYRELHTEALVAFVLGVSVNFIFWLLIGRYNPVKSSDEIQVMGLDD